MADPVRPSCHGYHNPQRECAARDGPLGSGFVLVIPTSDLDHAYEVWQRYNLTITLEPEDAFWARIFYGLDPGGYEVMFEQAHDRVRPEP